MPQIFFGFHTHHTHTHTPPPPPPPPQFPLLASLLSMEKRNSLHMMPLCILLRTLQLVLKHAGALKTPVASGQEQRIRRLPGAPAERRENWWDITSLSPSDRESSFAGLARKGWQSRHQAKIFSCLHSFQGDSSHLRDAYLHWTQACSAEGPAP